MKKHLKRLGVTQADLARAIGLEESEVSRKIRGIRRWYVSEANATLHYLRRFDASLSFDDLFAARKGDPK